MVCCGINVSRRKQVTFIAISGLKDGQREPWSLGRGLSALRIGRMMLAWDAFEKDPRTYGRSENGRESGITTMGVNVFTGDEKKSRACSVRCMKFPCMNRDSDCVSAAVGAEITCGLSVPRFFCMPYPEPRLGSIQATGP